jgi:hypothetical protein
MNPRQANAFFTTPWVPSLRGVELPICDFTIAMIEQGDRPSSRKETDAAWTMRGCEASIQAGNPLANYALYESVVELWRLREALTDGRADEVYQDHLEAWLVRRDSGSVGVGG